MPLAPTNIKSLARAHTESAIRVLAGIMNQEDCTPPARVAAAVALMDRGWGKPTQPVSGEEDGPAIIHEIRRTIVRPES